LLRAWGNGDLDALARLTPLVYRELHRRAASYMRNERKGATLQASALVNEAWLRLVEVGNVDWQDRVHFFAVSAQMMRRILVDGARLRRSAKRGGPLPPVNLDDAPQAAIADDHTLVALDDALKTLAEMDSRKAQVVEMRYFGGLSVEETAAALKISPQSVMRDWKTARAWLMRELTRER